jgi:glycosyltransferase involved in cell wall biosynthesis
VAGIPRVSDLALHRGRPLRVLHGCYEVAGQGMMLARGLAEHGCEAHSLAYSVGYDGRRPDYIVELDRHATPAGKVLARLGAFLRYGTRFDIYHFHFGTSFFRSPRFAPQRSPAQADAEAAAAQTGPRGGSTLNDQLREADLWWIRSKGKGIAFHFHGCEVRNRAHMLATHRLATCAECRPFCVPREQARTLALAGKYADRRFFSTLDLAESVPGGEHLPLAIEADRWERAALDRPLPDLDRRDGVRGPVVIAHAHAPAYGFIKGTPHLEAAVGRLRAEFPRVELRMIHGQPWETMPEFLAGCDILVDQLMMGWYGLFAIEGMAERRPVVSYLREDLRPWYPDCPIVSAEPDTLYTVLRDLVRDPARRAQLGERGARFARERHDTKVVGEKLLRAYRAMLGLEPPFAASAPAPALAHGGRPGEAERGGAADATPAGARGPASDEPAGRHGAPPDRS